LEGGFCQRKEAPALQSEERLKPQIGGGGKKIGRKGDDRSREEKVDLNGRPPLGIAKRSRGYEKKVCQRQCPTRKKEKHKEKGKK